MSSAIDISAAWIAQALDLKRTEPARYVACALAIRQGEAWKPMLIRLGLEDGTAMGVRMLEDRTAPVERIRRYSGP